MFVYEDKMYVLVSGIELYEIDTTFPYNTTLINDNTAFFGPGEFNNQYLRAWSNSGECSSNLSFIPTNETTTTTTSVTTLPPDAPNTIWIKFDPIPIFQKIHVTEHFIKQSFCDIIIEINKKIVTKMTN